MIKPIQATIHILRGNVTLDGKTVPVIKRNYPLDKTPCINIDDSASVTTVGKKIYNRKNNEGEPRQYYRVHRRTLLNIHCWMDNEQQREDITQQVISLFNKAYLDCYLFCTRYDKTTMQCETLGRQCEASVRGKPLHKSIKDKCPQPTTYNYENIYTRYDLIKAEWDLQTPFSADLTNTKPPALHSIFRLNAEYYDYVEIGGITSKDLKISEKLKIDYGKEKTKQENKTREKRRSNNPRRMQHLWRKTPVS